MHSPIHAVRQQLQVQERPALPVGLVVVSLLLRLRFAPSFVRLFSLLDLAFPCMLRSLPLLCAQAWSGSISTRSLKKLAEVSV